MVHDKDNDVLIALSNNSAIAQHTAQQLDVRAESEEIVHLELNISRLKQNGKWPVELHLCVQ